MPSIDLHNCIQNPLAVVGRLFDENWAAARTRGNADFGVSDHFDRLFDTPDKLAQIPSLNDTPWRRLRHNTLVRFRCMVQDTGLGQEYFVAAFETTDAVSGVKKWTCYQYTDDPVPEQNDALDTSTIPTDLFGEKQLLYCVSVPAETAWAARAHTGHGGAGRDDNDIVRQIQNINVNDDSRRAEVDEAGTGSFVPEKYPFSGEHHVAAVVKIYGRDNSLKVSEIVEFIGVLGGTRPTPQEPEFDDFGALRTQFGGVPIVHAITYRKIQAASFVPVGSEVIAAVLHNTPEIRAQLLKYIASAFGGDRLVAEFVLLQLLSRIHTRKGSLTLGNLTLNITHFPTPPAASATNPAIRPFASLLASLMPKYHDLSLTLAALNRAWFFPRSVDEVLKAGVLQLPEGTTIVVDETVLEEGVLGDQGVRNIQALSNLLTNQTLAYAFPYSSFEFPTDINVIVLSTGAKSLLPNHCAVPLQPIEPIREHDSSEDVPNAATLALFRGFVQCLKYQEYEISKEMSEFIQNAFVEQRRLAVATGAPLFSQEDLMLRMSLARLIAQSFGQTRLTVDAWHHAVALDEERRRRIAGGGFAGAVDVGMGMGEGANGRVGK